jgi:hypothetical protein
VTTITQTAAMRGQAPGPMPPLRRGEHDRHGADILIVGQRRAQEILAPGGHEVDDDHHYETVPHERQADHPERAPDAGAVDVSKDR